MLRAGAVLGGDWFVVVGPHAGDPLAGAGGRVGSCRRCCWRWRVVVWRWAPSLGEAGGRLRVVLLRVVAPTATGALWRGAPWRLALPALAGGGLRGLSSAALGALALPLADGEDQPVDGVQE